MSNDPIELTIETFAQSGEGLVHMNGRTVLFSGTMPGERVRVRASSGRSPAELLEVLAPSEQRVTPVCPIVDRCGGCTWQHVSPGVQQQARLDQLRRALPPTLRELPITSKPAHEAYGYRCRARLLYESNAQGCALGFRARSTHRLADAPGCPILHPTLQTAFDTLRTALAGLPGRGELSLALGHGGRAVVSIRPERMPDAAGFALVERLLDAGFVGASLWPPGASAPAIAGDPRPCVQGADGEPLWLAPEGFSQANEALNVELAAYVREQAACAGRTVLELFAGAGNFTVLLARDAKKITAVESDRAATSALQQNVQARGLTNVTAVCEDATPMVAARRADVIVLDPPRTGAREACEAIAAKPPERVVYVSCDPATLGRDLATLSRTMEVTTLAAFEMFPQTPHIETVATLVRQRSRR